MRGSLPFLRLPIFNFFEINNKSEPVSDWIKVRIILFCWRLRRGIRTGTPFVAGGYIILPISI